MINKKIWTTEKQHNLDSQVDELIDTELGKACKMISLIENHF